MKTLLGLVCALLVALPALAGVETPPAFPFQTYPQARQVQPACGGTAVAADISDDWIGLSSDTKDVFFHLTNGEVDYVYLAVGTSATGPRVVQMLSLKDAKARYPDLCAYFTEVAA